MSQKGSSKPMQLTETIKAAIKANGQLQSASLPYISQDDDSLVTLDGQFTLDDLRSIVAVMEGQNGG